MCPLAQNDDRAASIIMIPMGSNDSGKILKTKGSSAGTCHYVMRNIMSENEYILISTSTGSGISMRVLLWE